MVFATLWTYARAKAPSALGTGAPKETGDPNGLGHPGPKGPWTPKDHPKPWGAPPKDQGSLRA